MKISQACHLFSLSPLLIALSFPVQAQLEGISTDELLDMSIEELSELIISTDKTPRKVSDVAAAGFIITAEDLRRSGVTNIADALRMVPGLHVSTLNSHAWAINARGLTDFFSPNLLVMIDGRSIYTADFSGVYWDTVDAVFDDIERIEVIRGSGGTVWGANAVSGIVNIITRSSKDTQGTLVKLAAGSHLQGSVTWRYGGQFNDQSHYRIYAKTRRYGDFDGIFEDNYSMRQAGFRNDNVFMNDKVQFTVQADAYELRRSEVDWITTIPGQGFARGHNILGRWTQQVRDNQEVRLQFYYDSYENDFPTIDGENNTLDFDLQHSIDFAEKRHQLIWGLGYRYIDNDSDGNRSPFLRFFPDDRQNELFSGFLQGTIGIIPNKLKLTLGTKFEKNDYTDEEYQPSIRLIWAPNERQRVWGAVSRAVRTPARSDADILTALPLPPEQNPFFPNPAFAVFQGSDTVKATELVSYELGYRHVWNEDFSFDVTAFYNDYDDIIDISEGFEVSVDPNSGAANLVFPVANPYEEQSWGFELTADWMMSETSEWQLAYSYLNYEQSSIATGIETLGQPAEHMLSLRNHWKIHPQVSLSSWLRYMDNITKSDFGTLDDYWTLDLQLAWKPDDALEFAVVGQDLLESTHQEYGADNLYPLASDVERRMYVQARVIWQ